ncbi:13629_t:CDS:2, partial [Dentiscutata heterogama]
VMSTGQDNKDFKHCMDYGPQKWPNVSMIKRAFSSALIKNGSGPFVEKTKEYREIFQKPSKKYLIPSNQILQNICEDFVRKEEEKFINSCAIWAYKEEEISINDVCEILTPFPLFNTWDPNNIEIIRFSKDSIDATKRLSKNKRAFKGLRLRKRLAIFTINIADTMLEF